MKINIHQKDPSTVLAGTIEPGSVYSYFGALYIKVRYPGGEDYGYKRQRSLGP